MSFVDASTTFIEDSSESEWHSARDLSQIPIINTHANRSFINSFTNYTILKFNSNLIDKSSSPFGLFKDLYVGLQRKMPIILGDFERYFYVTEKVTTATKYKRYVTFGYTPRYINVVPLFLCDNMMRSPKHPSKLVVSRARNIHHFVIKLFFNSDVTHNNRIEKLYKCIDSYVSSLFDDMLNKWFQWTGLINQKGGTYRLEQCDRDELKRQLYKKFWQVCFQLQDSKNHSINHFKNSIHNKKYDQNNVFGCWIDLQNDILIFASRIFERNGKISHTVNAIWLSDYKTKHIAYMISLYINLACLSCFVSTVS